MHVSPQAHAVLFIIREECDIGKDGALKRCKSSRWKAHTTSLVCVVADALPVGDLLRTAGWTALGLSRHRRRLSLRETRGRHVLSDTQIVIKCFAPELL